MLLLWVCGVFELKRFGKLLLFFFLFVVFFLPLFGCTSLRSSGVWPFSQAFLLFSLECKECKGNVFNDFASFLSALLVSDLPVQQK